MPRVVKNIIEPGSDSDENSSLELKINEDYARKFEHNKRREELQTCKRIMFNREYINFNIILNFVIII